MASPGASTALNVEARTVSRPVELGLLAALAFFALFHIYTALFGMFEPLIQRSIFVGVGLFLAFVTAPQQSTPRYIVSWILGGVALYSAFHVVLGNERLMDVLEDLTQWDKIVGVLTIACVLEAARRTIGWAMPVICVIGLVYYLGGNAFIDGQWRPPALSSETAMRTLTSQTSGVYGYLADVGTRVIAIFIVYGSILMATGGGEAFMRAAAFVAGRRHGGPAKVAVVSSALFGTVSGSAVANVMAVGTVTIPAMVRAGYSRTFAAGVEATASTGGQIMPPIMGAGAFIMAEWLNIPYSQVAIAAIIPALLYFAAVFISVDAFARLHGIKPMPREELPTLRDVFDVQTSLPAFGSIVLLAAMLFNGYSPTGAGGFTVIGLLLMIIVVRLIPPLIRLDGRAAGAALVLCGRQFLLGLIDAGRNLVMIAAILACAGIVVTVLTASGVAIKFSVLLTSFADVNAFWLLVLTAVLCIILGMDVPTTASYILTASVAAAALSALGLPPLTAHMFIFYFAILSAITPPVCASVYAAATIAQENFWRVARESLRIGASIYFIPFMFVYRPELLMVGSPIMILYNTSVTLLAIYAMTGALLGYYVGRAGPLLRVLLLVVAIVLYIPTVWADIIGIVAAVAIAGMQYFTKRKVIAAEASGSGALSI